MIETECAYFAGVVDGEGCIRINRVKSHDGYFTYRPWLSITNNDKRIIDRLEGLSKPSAIYQERQGHYREIWLGSHCVEVLKAIRPWLIGKAEQADIVIDFAKHITALNGSLTHGVPEAELRWREEQIAQLSKLKKVKEVPYDITRH